MKEKLTIIKTNTTSSPPIFFTCSPMKGNCRWQKYLQLQIQKKGEKALKMSYIILILDESLKNWIIRKMIPLQKLSHYFLLWGFFNLLFFFKGSLSMNTIQDSVNGWYDPVKQVPGSQHLSYHTKLPADMNKNLTVRICHMLTFRDCFWSILGMVSEKQNT